mmetsp:Transcript_154901/g.496380  ORF Transcript_154901/g.496380 Transcript_154901/m.496380 type:complete len:81 (+) Transcript_154901:844-1086(+)
MLVDGNVVVVLPLDAGLSMGIVVVAAAGVVSACVRKGVEDESAAWGMVVEDNCDTSELLIAVAEASVWEAEGDGAVFFCL